MSYVLKHRKIALASAGVAQWLGRGLAKRKVVGSISSQGACLGCRLAPQLGRVGEVVSTTGIFDIICTDYRMTYRDRTWFDSLQGKLNAIRIWHNSVFSYTAI